MRLQKDRSMEGRKVKNGRMEVRMECKYGMALLSLALAHGVMNSAEGFAL